MAQYHVGSQNWEKRFQGRFDVWTLLLLENYKINKSSVLYEKIERFVDELLVLLLPDKKS